MCLTLAAYAQPIKGAGLVDEYLWVRVGPVVTARVGFFLKQVFNEEAASFDDSVGSLVDSFRGRPQEIAKVGALLQSATAKYLLARGQNDIVSAQTELLYIRLFSDVLRYLIQTKPDGSFLNHVVVRWF